jgi:uncharacterized protein (TIGR03083 family)
MTTLADRTIAALRASHDELAALVPDLSDAQLGHTSGAAEWSVAQVLSHLGSGAEIGLAGLAATLEGDPIPGQEFNQGVWQRWNALGAREQADGFVEHNGRLVAAYEALTSEQRESVRVEYSFLPEPLPLAAVAGMRLNESALHSWDARVALDPHAVVAAATADVLIEHLAGDLAFMLGFVGKADVLARPAVVAIQGSPVRIAIADRVALTTDAAAPATATLSGPREAVLRLLAGRLDDAYTPEGVDVTGDVTLDDLRKVFPGY